MMVFTKYTTAGDVDVEGMVNSEVDVDVAVEKVFGDEVATAVIVGAVVEEDQEAIEGVAAGVAAAQQHRISPHNNGSGQKCIAISCDSTCPNTDKVCLCLAASELAWNSSIRSHCLGGSESLERYRRRDKSVEDSSMYLSSTRAGNMKLASQDELQLLPVNRIEGAKQLIPSQFVHGNCKRAR